MPVLIVALVLIVGNLLFGSEAKSIQTDNICAKVAAKNIGSEEALPAYSNPPKDVGFAKKALAHCGQDEAQPEGTKCCPRSSGTIKEVAILSGVGEIPEDEPDTVLISDSVSGGFALTCSYGPAFTAADGKTIGHTFHKLNDSIANADGGKVVKAIKVSLQSICCIEAIDRKGDVELLPIIVSLNVVKSVNQVVEVVELGDELKPEEHPKIIDKQICMIAVECSCVAVKEVGLILGGLIMHYRNDFHGHRELNASVHISFLKNETVNRDTHHLESFFSVQKRYVQDQVIIISYEPIYVFGAHQFGIEDPGHGHDVVIQSSVQDVPNNVDLHVPHVNVTESKRQTRTTFYTSRLLEVAYSLHTTGQSGALAIRIRNHSPP